MTTPAVGRRLAWQIGAGALARFFIGIVRRFVYPFAPAFSRGLGVPLTAITSLIALNQLAGVLSPLFGPLSDRWGYRTMMLAGLSLLTAGMFMGGLLPFYGVLLIGLFLSGLGKSLFDPNLQAYVGQNVPYQRRGRVIGLMEFGWAGASLIGIPLVGVLIDRLGWRAPFFMLGGLGLLNLAVFGLVTSPDRRQPQPGVGSASFRQAWQRLRQEPAAVGALAFNFCFGAAHSNLFVVYGAWLEKSFTLGVVALGTTATILGIGELIGETITAMGADRLGLRRVILVGAGLVTFCYAWLPLIGQSLPLALSGLFMISIVFELTILTGFSLCTELLPDARATMMSSFMAASSLGRVIGALSGGLLWLSGGVLANSLISAAVSAVGLAFLLWGLRHWRASLT